MCSSHLSLSAITLTTNTCGGSADWPSGSSCLVAPSYNERDLREARAGTPKQPLMDSCVRPVNLGPGRRAGQLKRAAGAEMHL